MSNFRFLLGSLLILSQTVMANCDSATDLLFYAYYLHGQGGDVAQQKLLFNKSLQLCPNRPQVHNTLASILKKQGKYSQAVYHYKQALKLRPDFAEAYHGLGETYYKQKRFPLSLEAHLHACQTIKDSKAQVIALLKNKRYAFTKKDEIIDQESLLVLYTPARLSALNKMLSECGLRDVVAPIHTFVNLFFGTNKTTLRAETKRQLDEIAAALPQSPAIIYIHGHADKKPFFSVSQAESDRRNWQLSHDRAVAVATALAQRGFSKERFTIESHSYKQPLVQGSSMAALISNRRIEIEVKVPVIKKPLEEYQ